jgi:hypothetical protein
VRNIKWHLSQYSQPSCRSGLLTFWCSVYSFRRYCPIRCKAFPCVDVS